MTDESVGRLYLGGVLDSPGRAGLSVRVLSVAAGESAKTLEIYGRRIDEVLAHGIDNRSTVFSLGGGAIANASGFLVSTLYRGACSCRPTVPR